MLPRQGVDSLYWVTFSGEWSQPVNYNTSAELITKFEENKTLTCRPVHKKMCLCEKKKYCKSEAGIQADCVI